MSPFYYFTLCFVLCKLSISSEELFSFWPVVPASSFCAASPPPLSLSLYSARLEYPYYSFQSLYLALLNKSVKLLPCSSNFFLNISLAAILFTVGNAYTTNSPSPEWRIATCSASTSVLWGPNTTGRPVVYSLAQAQNQSLLVLRRSLRPLFLFISPYRSTSHNAPSGLRFLFNYHPARSRYAHSLSSLS